MLQRLPGDEVGHADRDQGDGEGEAHPEAPGHVLQLRVPLLPGRDGTGLQRHAADGARAWSRSDDLRVHGAGVLDRRGHRRCTGSRYVPGTRLRARIPFGIRDEPVVALRATEVVGAPLVLDAPAASSGGVHAHAADRIALSLGLRRGRRRLTRRRMRHRSASVVLVVVHSTDLLSPLDAKRANLVSLTLMAPERVRLHRARQALGRRLARLCGACAERMRCQGGTQSYRASRRRLPVA